MHRIVVTRLVPVTASVAIHVALVGGASLLPAWTAPRESVVLLELVEPEAPPVPIMPPPIKHDRRPLTLPRPIATPLPAPPPVERPKPPEKRIEPAPPHVEAPTPEPARQAAADPVTPGPPSSALAAAGPGPSAGTFATDAAPPSAPAARAGPAVAGLPPDGITQQAIPRGGYQYRPDYPATARNRNIQGTTLLDVLVADDGRVADVVVKQSAGHPDLDRAAADAVRRWRFEPARRGTEAVAMRVLLPVVFKLKKER